MNEQTICLLLKEQSDALNARMDAQIAAITVELQATKLARSGGGDQVSTIPRAMRLDVPKFFGTDPERWVFSITKYFALLDTPVDQRLKVVGFNLEGDAAEWFRWMSCKGLITTWDNFLESVQHRFGPCKYEDPQGALSKLLQTGTVAQYQCEFEKLIWIENSLLFSKLVRYL
ncbi:ty3-gypsy retrotransposon protein [Tanacetum coccineum]